MYKIFFEDRLILISSELDFKNIKVNSIYFYYKNKNTFIEIIKKFKENPEIKLLNIITKKSKGRFKQIKNEFKTINAAGGLVFNDKYQMLVIKRNGKWDLPKGKVEENEKIKTAAVREVVEECGISNIKIRYKIDKTYHTYNYKNKDIFKTTYWYLMQYKGNEDLIPQAEEGITEVKWLDISKIDEVLLNTHDSLMDLFLFVKNTHKKI